MTRAATRLAVTLGDPRGIGPEVAAAAIAALTDDTLELVAVGPRGTVLEPDVDVGSWDQPVGEAEPGEDADSDDAPPGSSTDPARFAEAGRLAGAAIVRATDLAMAGEVDGIVTAPIDKAALSAAGYNFPGHTEMLGSLTGAGGVVMMMAAEQTRLGGPLRVVLATTHIPLREVPAAATAERLAEVCRRTASSLRDWWGMDAPRLALCALNPHASDGGLFGDEEARVLAPVVETLVEEGLDVTGPVPADTVFVRAMRGEFDVVVAPYHDVGMAAFKTAAFGAGVNVTLGLPFPRTSPDHGTALDIAGRGTADPASMMEAVRLAHRLASIREST